MRPQTKTDERIARHQKMATAAGLTYPRGRAIVLENRIQNHGRLRPNSLNEADAMLDLMKRIKLGTAKRWQAHYDNGGSIRVLTRTRQEQAAFRQDQRRRSLP